jgi:hypothetical protein
MFKSKKENFQRIKAAQEELVLFYFLGEKSTG